MSATADQELAELRRAYAELQKERDSALAELQARTTALAQRDSEYSQRIEQQSATLDVLKLMSASPGDPQPVFDLIVTRARDLCDAYGVTVYEFDGSLIHWRASTGVSDDPSVRQAVEAMYPMAPSREWGVGRAIMDCRIHRIDDLETEPGLNPALRAITAKSQVALPLMRGDMPIGALALGSRERGGFSDNQVTLLQTFAEQAVIAITSAETYRALHEALGQQTATAEVLQVINASPGDLTPVFEAMLDKAVDLCGAAFGILLTYDGERFHHEAFRSIPMAYVEFMRKHPPNYGPENAPGRLALGECLVHVLDITDSDAYRSGDSNRRAIADLAGARTLLAVPLRKDSKLVGCIVVFRQEVRAFSDKQIALLENFAAQGVIAMENARLLTETREALEQQTATAEVLQVVNASPGNLKPVFEAVLERAHTLCGAPLGSLVLRDGEMLRAVATRGYPPEYEALARQGFSPIPPFKALLSGETFVHVSDTATWPMTSDEEEDPMRRAAINLTGIRTALFLPLRRDNMVLGYISAQRPEVRPFTDKQIALLQNFAAQAVIAMENARLLTETREALEQQTATAEVLGVINSNPGDLAPVFDAILEKAHGLCGIAMGSLELYDGQRFRAVAVRGLSDALADMLRQGYAASENPVTRPLIEGGRLTHIRDLTETDYAITRRGALEARTLLCVPMRRENTLIGMIASSRREVRPFSDKEIALLENFAAQAVIAMENARLLTETRDALERQTATAQVLQVINASPGDLTPVFDAILEKAHILCSTACGSLELIDRGRVYAVAVRGFSDSFAEVLLNGDWAAHQPATRPLLHGEQYNHITDVSQIDHPTFRRAAQEGLGTVLFTPLRKDGALLGMIASARREVRPFADKEIAFLESFAAQAVIAMENARLLNEVRQRQEELRVTFENMGDGVAMFDETQHLAAWNGKFQEIFDLPDALLAQHCTYEELLRFLAARGDFGASVDNAEQINQLVANTGHPYGYERTRPDGRVIEIRRNPVPVGGFVLIFSDITARKRSEVEIRAARDAAEAAYGDLKAAQASLIQAEKMASLGQLTAGIAHEIKNPLNFVNNFASLSIDLLDELKETAAPGLAMLEEARRAEADEIASTLASNLAKINEHGRRADGIVRGMLEHSRGSSGERREVEVNALVDEALNLAYHGARAQDQSFNVTLQREFSEGIAPITLAPQDVTRVLLNLISNGFYAARERQRTEATAGFEPTLKVSTHDQDGAVEIRVRDNGIGIPAEIRDRLFQPFFTTKPPGEGTGLGLSMSYDIITQQHGGRISVDSKVGEHSEFTVRLPRNS
jgi:two-component system NtrC family sensor kinase